MTATQIPPRTVVLDQIELALVEAIDRYADQVEAEFTRRVALGVSAKEVAKQMLIDVEAMTGMFAGAKQTIAQVAGTAPNIAGQSAYMQAVYEDMAKEGELDGMTVPYTWMLDAGADHCDTCAARANDTRTLQEWLDVGLPGSGVTDCRHNCRCSLVPAKE